MASISLATYTIRLYDQNRQDAMDYLRLGSIARQHGLLDMSIEYLRDRESRFSMDDEGKKLLRIRQFYPQGNSVSGIVQTGEYGYEAPLYNVDKATVSYQRTLTDAEMMPYYFLMRLPDDADKGIIILQRRGNLGIRTAFLKDLVSFLQGHCQGIKVEINSLLHPDVIDTFMRDGRLSRIRFISHEKQSDIADQHIQGGPRQVEGTAELSFTPNRGESLPWLNRISEVMQGARPVQNMVELHDYRFEYDNVKAEFTLGSKKKTVDLSNFMNTQAYIDVTGIVEIGGNGHPVYNSIEAVSRDIMGELVAELSDDA